jgi:hypothetical protein
MLQVVPLPFKFPFFGDAKNAVAISPNGGLNFNLAPPCCCLPPLQCSLECAFSLGSYCNLENSYRNIIAPLVTDYNPAQIDTAAPKNKTTDTGYVEYAVTNEAFSVRYYNMPLYFNFNNDFSRSNLTSMTTTIFPSGKIIMRFERAFDVTAIGGWGSGRQHILALRASSSQPLYALSQDGTQANVGDWSSNAAGVYAPAAPLIQQGLPNTELYHQRTLSWYPAPVGFCSSPKVVKRDEVTLIRLVAPITFDSIDGDLQYWCRFNMDRFNKSFSAPWGNNTVSIETPANLTRIANPRADNATVFECFSPNATLYNASKAFIQLVGRHPTDWPYSSIVATENAEPGVPFIVPGSQSATTAQIEAATITFSSNATQHSRYNASGELCESCLSLVHGLVNYCYSDCAEVFHGTAETDSCGVCSGGTTNHVFDSDVDCEGVCFGSTVSTPGTISGQDSSSLCVCPSRNGAGISSTVSGACFSRSGAIPGFSPEQPIGTTICMSPRSGAAGSNHTIRFFTNETTLFNIVSVPELRLQCRFGSGDSTIAVPATFIPRNSGDVPVSYPDTSPSFDVNNIGQYRVQSYSALCTAPLVHAINATVKVSLEYYNVSSANISVVVPNSGNYHFTYLAASDPRLVAFQPSQVGCYDCQLLDKERCRGDCTGTLRGGAVFDDCNVCSGGTSGHVANSDQDCNGVCFGLSSPSNVTTFNAEPTPSDIANLANNSIVIDASSGSSSTVVCSCAPLEWSNCTAVTLRPPRAESDTQESIAYLFSQQLEDVSLSVSATLSATTPITSLSGSPTAFQLPAVDLPFTFSLFGVPYRRVYINPYGALQFDFDARDPLTFVSASSGNLASDRLSTLQNIIAGLLSEYDISAFFNSGRGNADALIEYEISDTSVVVTFKQYKLNPGSLVAAPSVTGSSQVYEFSITLYSNSHAATTVVTGDNPSQFNWTSSTGITDAHSAFAGTRSFEGAVSAAIPVDQLTSPTARVELCSIGSRICLAPSFGRASGFGLTQVMLSDTSCLDNFALRRFSTPLPPIISTASLGIGMNCSFGGGSAPAFYNTSSKALVCRTPIGKTGTSVRFSIVSAASGGVVAGGGVNFQFVADNSTLLDTIPALFNDPKARCQVCSTVMESALCPLDCDGEVFGTASLDMCRVCSGGATGLIPNADLDCMGVCFGPFTQVGSDNQCGCTPFDPEISQQPQPVSVPYAESNLNPAGIPVSGQFKHCSFQMRQAGPDSISTVIFDAVMPYKYLVFILTLLAAMIVVTVKYVYENKDQQAGAGNLAAARAVAASRQQLLE